MKRALLLVTLLAVSGCGGSTERLLFERSDGSQIEMPGRPLVWCGPWSDVIPDRALHVAAVGGVKRQAREEWVSYWQLWAIPAHIERRAVVRFPGDYTFDEPSGVVVFVGDADTKNEASTTGEDSSGQIVFAQAGCKAGSAVEFTIDAVVDSEFGDGDPIRVTGTLRGVIGEPPAGWYD